jgi:hypothetical protein
VQSKKALFDKEGVTVFVVSFAQPERLVGYQQEHRWPFVVLADPDRTAYQAFGLKRLSWFRVFSPATIKLYFDLLRKGRRPRSYGADDYYQGGGDFIMDREGKVLFSHPSDDPSDRPSVSRLLEEVKRIRATTTNNPDQ